MRTKVYFGGKPCVQSVATVMARAVQQNSEPLPPSYMPEGLAVAFIGSSDKGGKPTKEVLDFIGIIDPKRVSRACIFATSGNGDATKVLDGMRSALTAKGIQVLDKTFMCHGKGSIGGKMPDDAELKKAEEFIKDVVKDFTD